MKKQLLAAAAALSALTMSPAAQASVSIACPSISGLSYCTFDEVSGSGTFGNTYLSATSFTDTFSLSLTSDYMLSVTGTHTADVGGPISFSSAQLLDSAMSVIGTIDFGAVPNTFSLAAGDYTLKFVGSTSSWASYQGTIDIASVPVPAPPAWSVMIFGIAAMGEVMRRRMRLARLAMA